VSVLELDFRYLMTTKNKVAYYPCIFAYLEGDGLATASGAAKFAVGARLIKPCWTSSTGLVSTGTVRHKTTCIKSQTGRRMREIED
jgi:hypothetical protein